MGLYEFLGSTQLKFCSVLLCCGLAIGCRHNSSPKTSDTDNDKTPVATEDTDKTGDTVNDKDTVTTPNTSEIWNTDDSTTIEDTGSTRDTDTDKDTVTTPNTGDTASNTNSDLDTDSTPELLGCTDDWEVLHWDGKTNLGLVAPRLSNPLWAVGCGSLYHWDESDTSRSDFLHTTFASDCFGDIDDSSQRVVVQMDSEQINAWDLTHPLKTSHDRILA